ncbi:MAG: hypothetical protein K2X97_14890 [Mycobacteriaceae bacterium]|nr:hypothetical protein [Mycobacteriaceae bacterium]
MTDRVFARAHRAHQSNGPRRGADDAGHDQPGPARPLFNPAADVDDLAAPDQDFTGLRIAYCQDWDYAAVDPDVRRVVREAVPRTIPGRARTHTRS